MWLQILQVSSSMFTIKSELVCDNVTKLQWRMISFLTTFVLYAQNKQLLLQWYHDLHKCSSVDTVSDIKQTSLDMYSGCCFLNNIFKMSNSAIIICTVKCSCLVFYFYHSSHLIVHLWNVINTILIPCLKYLLSNSNIWGDVSSANSWWLHTVSLWDKLLW